MRTAIKAMLGLNAALSNRMAVLERVTAAYDRFLELTVYEHGLQCLMRATGYNRESCISISKLYELPCQDLAEYYKAFGKFPKRKQLIIIRHFGISNGVRAIKKGHYKI